MHNNLCNLHLLACMASSCHLNDKAATVLYRDFYCLDSSIPVNYACE